MSAAVAYGTSGCSLFANVFLSFVYQLSKEEDFVKSRYLSGTCKSKVIHSPL